METQAMTGRGRRVRVYFGESDRHEGRALWSALLDTLRRRGAAGATILRGLAGYGAHSRVHAATLVDLSSDLPLVLEWIDTEQRVRELLPEILAMVDGGMVTSEPVEIHRYTAHEATGRH
ncbi:MAG: DUF190 domain-containing protein [Chloroflexota bacterium]|nr:DUF190 domain-containing protein [Chloroflexota bacterium]